MSAPAETVLGGKGHRGRDLALWGGAALVAALAHLAVVAVLYAAVPEDGGLEAFEEAMVIDLAPLPIAAPQEVASEMLAKDSPEENLQPVEEAVEVAAAEPAPIIDPVEPPPVDDVAPEDVTEPVAEPVETVAALEPTVEPEVVQAEPVEQDTADPEPVQAESIEPEPVSPDTVEVAAVEPEMTQDVVEPEIVETDVFEALTPEVVIPLPQPRPEKPAEVAQQREKKPERPREVAKKQAPDESARPARREKPEPTAKPRSEAPSVRSAQASVAPKISPARWHNQVRAAIVRRIARVRGMRGTVRVQFVVSQSGSVMSASVAGSSGDGSLDNAAVRMVRQAQVPPPPDGIGGEHHAFSVPLTFK